MAAPVLPSRSRKRCGDTSASSCSAPRCPAPYGSPKPRATGCRRSPTTVAPPEPTPTGRWRWSLSSAPESPQRRGLGRGLEVLLGGGEATSPDLADLPVDAVHPNPRQPRRRFEPEAASGLAESVRRQGVIQPLLVRPRSAGGYEIVAGERRWRAAREAGRETVPAVIRVADDRD